MVPIVNVGRTGARPPSPDVERVGCGISFRTPSIIGPLISVVTPSLLPILGPHVEHCYARLYRAPDLEILFFSEAIVKNLM